MKKKLTRIARQLFIYLPLAGIISASFLKLSNFQQQLLMLLLLVWANAFFLYKSWVS